MESLQITDHYQVVKVELAAGCSMPRHVATSDAFVIVESGTALLIFSEQTYELSKGVNMAIPANEQHMLKILEDFKAYIVLANTGRIQFAEKRESN
jgi:quercetin dioxygenase-like cupin family protein